MPTTYEKIATTTLGSAASTITFSSIAASWTDIRLVVVAKNVTLNDDIQFRFNSDSGSNYSWTTLSGNGTAAATSRSSNNTKLYATAAGNLSTAQFGLATMDIFSYAGSTYKTCLITGSYDENGSGWLERDVGLWRSTAAITAIEIFSTPTDFAIGTTATLYGILKA